MRKTFLSLGLVLVSLTLSIAQSFDGRSFSFLNLPVTATQQASGLRAITGLAFDGGLWWNNPAYGGTWAAQNAGLHQSLLFGGVSHTFLHTHPQIQKVGQIDLGMQYLHYGRFEGYDDLGNETGTFQASDMQWAIGKSFESGPFHYGMQLKWIQSGLMGQRSFGMAMSLGGLFVHPEKDLIVGMSIQHAGIVFRQLHPGLERSFPLHAQVGISFKPEFLPIRFTINMQDLQRWDLIPYDSLQQAFLGLSEPNFAQRLFTHFSGGAELMLHKHVHLLAGYHHLSRYQLRSYQLSGPAGFSIGTRLFWNHWELAISRAWYHQAGGISSLSLMVDMQLWSSNKTSILD